MDLSQPSDNVVLQKKFSTCRGKIAFASTCTRPDTSFDSAQLLQVISTSVERKNVAIINKTIRKLNYLAHIVYLPLDLRSTYIVGYADAAFANNADNSSQLGSIVLLKDKNDHAAIIHYGSWKFQRVTRSVLGAEVHAFSH